MTVSIARTDEEIQLMPQVELAFLLLRTKQEPMYFREIMAEIQALRKLTDDQVTETIARLYTEINIDGRFICTGQNIWGLKRWYPVDKPNDRPTSRRFVRSTGDAFSDEDEELDDYDEASDDDSSDFEVPKKTKKSAVGTVDDSDDDSEEDVDDSDSGDDFEADTEDSEDEDLDFAEDEEAGLAEDEESDEEEDVEESDSEEDEERY